MAMVCGWRPAGDSLAERQPLVPWAAHLSRSARPNCTLRPLQSRQTVAERVPVDLTWWAPADTHWPAEGGQIIELGEWKRRETSTRERERDREREREREGEGEEPKEETVQAAGEQSERERGNNVLQP